MSEQKKAFVRRFFEEFSAGNIAAVKEMMAPNHLFHFPLSPEPLDRDAHSGTQAMMCAAVPDLLFTLEDQIAEGDKVASRFSASGTFTNEFQGLPPTGGTLTIRGTNIMQIVDGKNVEEWDSIDTLSMMQQLGAIPTPEQG